MSVDLEYTPQKSMYLVFSGLFLVKQKQNRVKPRQTCQKQGKMKQKKRSNRVQLITE
jgi:hypothetical protein